MYASLSPAHVAYLRAAGREDAARLGIPFLTHALETRSTHARIIARAVLAGDDATRDRHAREFDAWDSIVESAE